jgi:FtsZ-binding cell division protein ZapB
MLRRFIMPDETKELKEKNEKLEGEIKDLEVIIKNLNDENEKLKNKEAVSVNATEIAVGGLI